MIRLCISSQGSNQAINQQTHTHYAMKDRHVDILRH